MENVFKLLGARQEPYCCDPIAILKNRFKALSARRLARSMLEQMKSINLSVDMADKGVTPLVFSVTKIKEISTLITDISGQTNLLALNAAMRF